jgi:biotin synthase
MPEDLNAFTILKSWVTDRDRVMIGLPFQTLDDLAADLLFMKAFDIDMVGMGPYLEHVDTPLYNFRETLATQQERFLLSLRMVAVLRIMMPDINIAATTAMQTIDPFGREKALQAGANVIMPNITPGMFKKHYLPYNNKPCNSEYSSEGLESTTIKFNVANGKIAYGEWGDSRHFVNRKL